MVLLSDAHCCTGGDPSATERQRFDIRCLDVHLLYLVVRPVDGLRDTVSEPCGDVQHFPLLTSSPGLTARTWTPRLQAKVIAFPNLVLHLPN